MAVTVSGAHFSTGGHSPVSEGHSGGADNLNLSSIAEQHATVAGGGSTGSGFDTVNAPGGSGDGLGQSSGGSDVVATQAQDGGNVVVHLSDGSSITVVGASHIDASFFSH